MLTVHCFDGMTGARIGSAEFPLHESGGFHVPEVEARFGARCLSLDVPEGIVIDSTATGHSRVTFADGDTARLYRWREGGDETLVCFPGCPDMWTVLYEAAGSCKRTLEQLVYPLGVVGKKKLKTD
jgi:hypothetical protein